MRDKRVTPSGRQPAPPETQHLPGTFAEAIERAREGTPGKLSADTDFSAVEARIMAHIQGEEVTGRQPIETAPKDGSRVRLFGLSPDGDSTAEVGRFSADRVLRDYPDEPVAPFWDVRRWDVGFCRSWQPTHWQPLPYTERVEPCPFIYRDRLCAYQGAMPDCDRSFGGPNGCRAHGNETRFGGRLLRTDEPGPRETQND